MKKKKVFITGILGQDGSYLAEYLLEKDYDVYGIMRRHSFYETENQRLKHLENKVNLEYGDVLDSGSCERLISLIKPDEIYHLAAQSHVGISFSTAQITTQINVLGTVNILEIFRNLSNNSRLYFAASSELFGDSIDKDGFQRETTSKTPVSVYGCSKLFCYSLVRNYRKSYKLFASNGILFNHGSVRRGSNFVEQKIAKNAVLIYYGMQDKLELGNMDSYRDWGCSKDYVKAMNMILNHFEPDDFVIATGETHNIRDMCEYVFSKLNMNYNDYVIQNPKYLRPEELSYLKGDSSKARKILNWSPEYSFESMLDEMIDYWLNELNSNKQMKESVPVIVSEKLDISNNLSLFTYTCSSELDLCPMYFGQIEKHIPYLKNHIITSNKHNDIFNKFNFVLYDEKDDYYKQYLTGLKNIKTPFVLAMFEDQILYNDVKKEYIEKYVNFLKKYNYSFFRLIKTAINTDILIEDDIYLVPEDSNYFFSVQPTIWKTSDLIKIMEHSKIKNIYEEKNVSASLINLKISGVYIFNNEKKAGRVHYYSSKFPVIESISNRKWVNDDILKPLFKEYNIDINVRGVR